MSAKENLVLPDKNMEIVTRSLLKYFRRLTRSEPDEELSDIAMLDILKKCTDVGKVIEAFESSFTTNREAYYPHMFHIDEYNSVIFEALKNYSDELKESKKLLSDKYGIPVTAVNNEIELINSTEKIINERINKTKESRL
jgi:hypothetical protein